MTQHTSYRTLHRTKRSLLPLVALAGMLLASASHAQMIFSDATTFNTATSPTNVPFTDAAGSALAYPYTVSATRNSQTFTLSFTNGRTQVNGNHFERQDAAGIGSSGNNAGDFEPGTLLLVNAVASATGDSNGMRIDFSSPVSAFGLNYQPTLFNSPTDFTFRVFEGGTSPTSTTTIAGVTNTNSTNPMGAMGTDTIARFFGVQDTGGSFITSILIFGSPTTGATNVNNQPDNFSVGLLRFSGVQDQPPTVPEPGALALLAAGLPAGFLIARRRSR